jgi:hypothetical protein
VADQIAVTVTPPGGRSDSASAALSALYHFPGRPTVDRLGQVLGLTHSGAVRLVDRLADAGRRCSPARCPPGWWRSG